MTATAIRATHAIPAPAPALTTPSRFSVSCIGIRFQRDFIPLGRTFTSLGHAKTIPKTTQPGFHTRCQNSVSTFSPFSRVVEGWVLGVERSVVMNGHQNPQRCALQPAGAMLGCRQGIIRPNFIPEAHRAFSGPDYSSSSQTYTPDSNGIAPDYDHVFWPATASARRFYGIEIAQECASQLRVGRRQPVKIPGTPSGVERRIGLRCPRLRVGAVAPIYTVWEINLYIQRRGICYLIVK
jgi:hypothetical protein